jgi:hypothetical protein
MLYLHIRVPSFTIWNDPLFPIAASTFATAQDLLPSLQGPHDAQGSPPLAISDPFSLAQCNKKN